MDEKVMPAGSGARAALAALILGAGLLTGAQQPTPPPAKERVVLVREAIVYISPDATSTKLGQAERGREGAVLDRSRQWIQVFINTEQGRNITGWILDKGLVRASTPDGDRILFGEAVDSETEAQRRRGRKNAAQDAMRLYYRTYEYFPSSPLAGEALYRAADIKWQVDAADAKSRPSAKDDPRYRPHIDEDLMREVRKKFPNTKWHALADFNLLENKLCGDWEGKSKCPEKDTEVYEEYVKDFPQSPKAAEALYLAATRQAALIEIYKTENSPSKSQEAKAKGIGLCQRVVSQFPDSDWAPRAARLAFLMEQGVPLYGNALE